MLQPLTKGERDGSACVRGTGRRADGRARNGTEGTGHHCDGIVLSVIFWMFSALFGTTSATGGEVSASVGGLPSLILFVVAFAYYILMEGYLGQTLGKMLLGIKVVREGTDGTPGLKAAAIRTVLRIVDGFFFYIVAFIAVLASQKNQRLGDMVAHTLVVRR